MPFKTIKTLLLKVHIVFEDEKFNFVMLSRQDPHAYFSRPDSSQSIYGQRGTKLDMDSFRAAMEAKQMEDESPPQRRGQPSQPPGFQAQLAKSASGNIVLRSASGVVLCRSDGTEGGTSGSMFDSERPSSAMSDTSINIPDLASHSRPSSRLGDDVSGMFDPFSEVPASFEPVTAKVASTDSGRVMSLNEDKDKYLQEKKKHREEKQRLEAEEKERIKRKEEEEKILADKLKQEKASAEEKKKLLQQKAEEKQRLEAEEERKRVELRQIEKEKKEKEELRIINEKKLAEEKAEKLRQEAEEKKKILQQKAEEKRLLEEEKKAKKLEEERRKTEEKRVLEEEKKAKKLEEQRKAEEKKIVEEEMKAKKLEEQRKAQGKIALEEEKKAKKLEEQRKAAEDKKRMESERKRKEDEELKQTKTDSKQRSFVKKKSDSKPKDKVSEETQPTASETPLLGKPKRRTSSTDPLSDTGRDSPVSILKGGKLSRDCSRDRAGGSDTDEILPGKPLSRTGSLKKSSSFSKKGILAEKKKISFDDVDMDKFKSSESEPITQAKQIFAAIADTTLEAGSTALRQRSRERPADSYSRTEPAEWDPEEDPDNEDELMIILDDNEQVRAKSGSYKSRSQSQSGDRSTGFSHLDDFEKRLAEMQDDLDTDEHKANKEPIYATILPNTERSATGSNRMTDDGYFINRDEELPYYEPEEDVGSEYSRKKVSFAQSEERFEFDVPKKESSFRSFTKFLAKELPLNFKRDPTLDERLARNDDINGLEKENIAPVAPRRSKSKTRSQSLQRYSQPAGERESMTGARSQSLSRTGDDFSAKSFFSAMTGGLYDPNISGSRGLRGSRPTSRQSSGDRSSLMSYEEDPSVMSGSEMMSDSSVFGQLKKIKLKQAKKVEQADFDKLFARGMEMSAMRDGSPEIKKVQKKRTTKVPAGDGLEEAMKKDNGIGYAEKVMSYLDDQAKAEMMQSEVDGCHVSRSRRKLRHKGESRTASESEGTKAKQSESRNRSREYTKPEDIKLSPVIKRDLFTGEIIFVPSNYKGPVTPAPAPAPPLITTEHVPVSEPVKEPPTKTHTQSLAPSPGKHFLDATTGQEVFGASIEGDNPELTAQLAASELLTNGHSPQKTVNSSAYEAYETIPAGRKKPPPQSAPAKVELPADKGIPSKLKPDKLLANEEFYEELRESMRQVEASQEDTETFTRYSHHLGRAEFGTLKKRTSTRPSAATSRDPSGDRVNLNRSLGELHRTVV